MSASFGGYEERRNKGKQRGGLEWRNSGTFVQPHYAEGKRIAAELPHNVPEDRLPDRDAFRVPHGQEVQALVVG